MRLNSIKPAQGAKRARKRVGRGIGCGTGKTCGRGHKGQRSRSGGYHKVGFEGGQMPLQRRLPKFGFHSKKAGRTAEIRLHELSKMAADVVDIPTLRQAKMIGKKIDRVKVIATGSIDVAVTLRGISTTKAARVAIEAAGGKIEQ